MIIPEEEIEKAAINYSVDVNGVSSITCEEIVFNASVCDFKAGVEFSEKYVQKHVQDIIIENQGLKLYKDNEAARFKELAIEFYNWMQQYQDLSAAIRINEVENSQELFEIFKKEKYEHEY